MKQRITVKETARLLGMGMQIQDQLHILFVLGNEFFNGTYIRAQTLHGFLPHSIGVHPC